MIRAWALGASFGALAALAAPGAGAQEARKASVHEVQIPAISLGESAVVKAGVRKLTAPVGAGASFSFRERRLFLLSGRGPSVTCAAAESIGSDAAALCKGDEGGRAYALPDFTPMIHEYALTNKGGFNYEFSLPLRGASGEVTALPNLPLTGFATEKPYDTLGQELKPDPSGLAPTGIVRLPDQSFYVGDANGPSLLHVAIAGEILDRLTPRGSAARFKGADYPVSPVLPAELAKSKPEGGITAVGASPDGGYAYFAAATPLGGGAEGRSLRLYRFNMLDKEAAGVWAYQLEPAKSFGARVEQSQVQLVDLDAVGGESLILTAESDGRRLKIFAVSLADGAKISDKLGAASGGAAYEALDAAGLRKAGLAPLKKTLVFDSADVAGVPENVGGLAVLALDTLLVANQHDGGLGGAEDQPDVKLITLSSPIVQRAAAEDEDKIETGETPAKDAPKKN